MSALTFKRGIHPKHAKHYTEKKPIKILEPKGELVFPMSQHIGAPCKPLVKKGDQVFVGQKIGEAQGFVSAPVHSSVSGTVKNVTQVLHPNGFMVEAVIVENDGEYTDLETINKALDYTKLSPSEIRDIVKDAGIVGMGGAGFPTFIKLTPPEDKKIDHIILNGAECEPYITSDHRIMLEETEKIVLGLKVVLKLFPEAKGVIAIEDNKPDAIAAMKKQVEGEKNIEVAVVRTKYPQGAEKQLIYAVTKREVPSGGLPADAGCIVQNIDTVVAIHRAIFRGRPLMRRVVTVSGGAINDPQNFKVKLGMSYRELIEAAGGFKEEPVKIISGGPMMGFAMYSIDAPVVKGTSSILCLTEEETQMSKESNCMRCGKCVEICPMNLLPLELNKFSLHNDEEKFVKYRGLDCIECGSCSYVCPSKRHLLQSIRTAKKEVIAKRRKK
jgi:electron transport complex protein RnfC